MWLVDPFLASEVRFRRAFFLSTVALGVLLALIMLSNPSIDLMAARALRAGCADTGKWCTGWYVEGPRRLLIALFMAGCAAASMLGMAAIYWRKHWTALDLARCWFLVAVLVVGPGLVANSIFKDNWGRARPREVVELGGTKPFTPPLLPATSCSRNCSFVSGEASSMFVLPGFVDQSKVGVAGNKVVDLNKVRSFLPGLTDGGSGFVRIGDHTLRE